MSGLRVLVTGASIAGPAVAWWLAETGHQVTVVEAASALREGGQNIDVRDTGKQVIERMGLLEAVKARNTTEVGTRFVDEHGGTVAEFGVDDAEGDGPTAELEILRGALSQVLVEACPTSVEWRFGDRVVGVEQDDDGVTVEFEGGGTERFDLLVVAEGVGSRTRALVFDAGEAPEERELGMYCAYATIPRTADDDHWWRWLNLPGKRQVTLRPDDVGTTRANFNFLVDSPVLDGLDDAALRAAIRERFADAGWEVPRILDGFDAADDLYVDWLRQVLCPTWHRGRVVLLGDAAWCVTPIAGGGTSLALTGAYVLAAYLSQTSSPTEAFERYEEWMRPLVETVQDLPPGTPRLAAPETRAGIAVLRTATRVAALPPVQAIANRLLSRGRDDHELPELRP